MPKSIFHTKLIFQTATKQKAHQAVCTISGEIIRLVFVGQVLLPPQKISHSKQRDNPDRFSRSVGVIMRIKIDEFIYS